MEKFPSGAEQVIEVVCEYYDVSRAEFMKSCRGVSNMERDLAVYLVCNLYGKTLPEVGRVFGMSDYSSVSRVVQRMKKEPGAGRKPGQEPDPAVSYSMRM